jgi:hypothetical protein
MPHDQKEEQWSSEQGSKAEPLQTKKEKQQKEAMCIENYYVH